MHSDMPARTHKLIASAEKQSLPVVGPLSVSGRNGEVGKLPVKEGSLQSHSARERFSV